MSTDAQFSIQCRDPGSDWRTHSQYATEAEREVAFVRLLAARLTYQTGPQYRARNPSEVRGIPAHLIGEPGSCNYAAAKVAEQQFTGRAQ